MTPHGAKKILIVEDERDILQLVRMYLEKEGFRALTASTGSEGLRLAKTEKPDLLILDLMLPEMDGLEVCKRLRSAPETAMLPIIMLTAKAEESDTVIGLELGADDYVTKPFSMRELLARIKAVLRRRAPQLADDIVEAFGLRLDPAARTLMAGDKKIELWATEFRLLHFFMTHSGRIFGRAKLLDEVWGDHVFVEERTVDVHIRRLRQALIPTGHDSLIETVRGIGYRFRPEPERQEPAPKPAAEDHSTVTDLAKLRGLSTSLPRARAA